jgi:hypothetical protein
MRWCFMVSCLCFFNRWKVNIFAIIIIITIIIIIIIIYLVLLSRAYFVIGMLSRHVNK